MTEVAYKSLIYALEAKLKTEADFNWLIFVSGDKIPQEALGEIKDVFTWFKELEKSGNLGIDNLEFLKDVLQELQQHSSLEKIVSFEAKRRKCVAPRSSADTNSGQAVISAEVDEDVYVSVNAPALLSKGSALTSGGTFSTISWAAGQIIGGLDIKCVYGLAGAGVLTGATHYILKHCQENPALVAAFNSCALPAGVKLIELSKGCVCLTVQAESLSALKPLWERYEDGSLQTSLRNLLITSEIKEIAEGKDVELAVSIDQDSYRNACLDLLIVENETRTGLQGTKLVPQRRRMSDSALLVKLDEDIVNSSSQQSLRLSIAAEEKRRELIEEELQRYSLQQIEEYEFRQLEASKYVSEYLEKLGLDSVSSTGDSGYRTEASSVVDVSELQIEEQETHEIGECKLADLPDNLLKRVCDCLATDRAVMEEFFEAFGLPTDIIKGTVSSSKFPRVNEMPIRSKLFHILKKYSTTPVQLLRDVCESLFQEESLVKSLDEAVLMYRPHHPLSLVRPLDEIRKLHEGILLRKPTTYIQKGRILIVKVHGYGGTHDLESFFRDLDPASEITTLEVGKDDIIKGLWRTVHSWQHNQNSFSFFAIFWLVESSKQSREISKAREKLENVVSSCSQITIIVTMDEELKNREFQEAIIVYVKPGLSILRSVNKGITSTFRQHRRRKDVFSLMKEYKRKFWNAGFIEITSTLSSKVMFNRDESARS